MTRNLQALVAGALKESINAHGPITATLIPSAAKRICGRLKQWESAVPKIIEAVKSGSMDAVKASLPEE